MLNPWLEGEAVEELIPDDRGGLSPSQMVEQKVAARLKCVGISQVIVCRWSSRGHVFGENAVDGVCAARPGWLMATSVSGCSSECEGRWPNA
jgi:hypothetical protein